MSKHKRWARVAVDEDIISQILFKKPNHKVNIKGLPKRAKLVRTFVSPQVYGFQFVFEHRSFKPVKEGEEIPPLYLYYERVSPTRERLRILKANILAKLNGLRGKDE